MRILFIILLPIISGCITLTTLQDPAIKQPGQVLGETGISSIGTSGVMTEFGMRVGLMKQIDIGGKLDGGSSCYWDARYQFLKDPIYVNIGLGFSYMSLKNINSQINDPSNFIAYQPFVLLGGNYWYLGIRPYYTPMSGKIGWNSTNLQFQENKWSLWCIAFGGCVPANRSKLLFEINYLHFSDGKKIFVPAIGVQTDLNLKELLMK